MLIFISIRFLNADVLLLFAELAFTGGKVEEEAQDSKE